MYNTDWIEMKAGKTWESDIMLFSKGTTPVFKARIVRDSEKDYNTILIEHKSGGILKTYHGNNSFKDAQARVAPMITRIVEEIKTIHLKEHMHGLVISMFGPFSSPFLIASIQNNPSGYNEILLKDYKTGAVMECSGTEKIPSSEVESKILDMSILLIRASMIGFSLNTKKEKTIKVIVISSCSYCPYMNSYVQGAFCTKSRPRRLNKRKMEYEVSKWCPLLNKSSLSL